MRNFLLDALRTCVYGIIQAFININVQLSQITITGCLCCGLSHNLQILVQHSDIRLLIGCWLHLSPFPASNVQIYNKILCKYRHITKNLLLMIYYVCHYQSHVFIIEMALTKKNFFFTIKLHLQLYTYAKLESLFYINNITHFNRKLINLFVFLISLLKNKNKMANYKMLMSKQLFKIVIC